MCVVINGQVLTSREWSDEQSRREAGTVEN